MTGPVTVRVIGRARGALAALVGLVVLQSAPIGAVAGQSPAGRARPVREHAEWRAAFDAAGVVGTFALRRIDGGAGAPDDVFDETRARRRYLPASTFKIPNSLIALELGVVRDERERFPMTWPRQDVPIWNREHTLSTALKYSVVPVYQIIARRVGEARYRQWLARLDYGNRDPGGGVDHFWLDGALRVSAIDQLDFLERLADLRLPMSERSQRTVREMLVREANDCYVIRSKTGLLGGSGARTLAADERVGWLVGWVESDSARFAFALNLDASAPRAAAARHSVARALLVRAGVIPARGCGGG